MCGWLESIMQWSHPEIILRSELLLGAQEQAELRGTTVDAILSEDNKIAGLVARGKLKQDDVNRRIADWVKTEVDRIFG